MADIAIVASPSPLHYQQGRECLNYCVHTLLEMPPCGTDFEAMDLAKAAKDNRVKIQGAHSSHYLASHKRIEECIGNGDLGSVRHVSFMRHIAPRQRSWTDDALLHHSAHPLDLLLHWFGEFAPKSCVALPKNGAPQSVSMLAELPNGAPASISVTYASHLPQIRMLIVGERHTVETDGFSYLRSDLPSLNLETAEVETYEGAIGDQDMDFVHACQGDKQKIDWLDSIRLIRAVNAFQALLRN